MDLRIPHKFVFLVKIRNRHINIIKTFAYKAKVFCFLKVGFENNGTVSIFPPHKNCGSPLKR